MDDDTKEYISALIDKAASKVERGGKATPALQQILAVLDKLIQEKKQNANQE
jgi:hypothetical protein